MSSSPLLPLPDFHFLLFLFFSPSSSFSSLLFSSSSFSSLPPLSLLFPLFLFFLYISLILSPPLSLSFPLPLTLLLFLNLFPSPSSCSSILASECGKASTYLKIEETVVDQETEMVTIMMVRALIREKMEMVNGKVKNPKTVIIRVMIQDQRLMTKMAGTVVKEVVAWIAVIQKERKMTYLIM
jgi:hypothetical protein